MKSPLLLSKQFQGRAIFTEQDFAVELEAGRPQALGEGDGIEVGRLGLGQGVRAQVFYSPPLMYLRPNNMTTTPMAKMMIRTVRTVSIVIVWCLGHWRDQALSLRAQGRRSVSLFMIVSPPLEG